MGVHSSQTSEVSPAQPSSSAEKLYVARQPIFDVHSRVHAYELLFRSGPENFFQSLDPDHASGRVIGDAFHVFGLQNLAQEKKLFINCTRKVLLEDYIFLLPPELTVVEVLETVQPTPEVIEACRRLKQAGYTLALDDFVMAPGMEPLVAMADIIKVDFLLTKGDERRQVVQQFRRPGLRFLAEKVETQADYQQGLKDGYAFFQGYFFCKPEMVTARDVPGSKWVTLRLLQALNAPSLEFSEIENILKQDVSLPVKLLRYLRSATFVWRGQINSIRQALVLLGEGPFRKWASLVTLTALGTDRPAELITTSLFRARFCELLGQQVALGEHELDLFLVGLLSSIDVLVGRPLPELLESMSVSPLLKQTLLGEDTRLSPVYRAVLAYERGHWEDALALLPKTSQPIDLPRLYSEAVRWASDMTSV